MRASCHMADDCNIVWLISKNEAGRRATIHQFRKHGRIGGIPANNAMRTEPKYIAEPRDRDGVGLGSKAPFGPFFIAEDNLIDLFQRKTGDFDRRISEDQFLEFDSQLGEIPLTFFAQPIDGEAQHTLFDIRQVINPDAGHGGKTQGLSRREPDFAVEVQIVLA